MANRDYESSNGRDWQGDRDGQPRYWDRQDARGNWDDDRYADDRYPAGRDRSSSGMGSDMQRADNQGSYGRQSNYGSQDRDYGNQNRNYGNRDRNYGRDYGSNPRGYQGGHMSGGAMGNRGMMGSNYLGSSDLSAGPLIGGGNSAGFGAGSSWADTDRTMDGYSGTMGTDDDYTSYGNDRGGRESHAGRGSKNYRRSDSRIEEDVHEALRRDHRLDATDVDVAVKDGEVTLSGEVADRDARRRAEQLCEGCAGVRDVHNELKARQGLWSNGDRPPSAPSKSAAPKKA